MTYERWHAGGNDLRSKTTVYHDRWRDIPDPIDIVTPPARHATELGSPPMNFRRYYVPNSMVFITNVVHLREPIFANETYLDLFRTTLRNTQELHPFIMLAYVFLPDHMHLLIRPTGASNFSQIMHSAKSYFTYAYKQLRGIDGSIKFWQKRFYDHIIRDEVDLANHLHYIHYNPVNHGYVPHPEDWPHSSFLAWKQRGAYPDQWGWSLPDTLASIQLDNVE